MCFDLILCIIALWCVIGFLSFILEQQHHRKIKFEIEVHVHADVVTDIWRIVIYTIRTKCLLANVNPLSHYLTFMLKPQSVCVLV